MVFKSVLTKKDIANIASDFKKTLKKTGIRASRLILFGSYARGKPHPWSDLDLCVVSTQFGKRYYDEMVRLAKLGKSVSYLIEAHPIHPKDLRSGAHPLAEEIKKHGKEL